MQIGLRFSGGGSRSLISFWQARVLNCRSYDDNEREDYE